MFSKTWRRLTIFFISCLTLIAGIGNNGFLYATDNEQSIGYQFTVSYDEDQKNATITGNRDNVDESVTIISVTAGEKELDVEHPQITVSENGEYTFVVRYQEREVKEDKEQVREGEETLSVTVSEIQISTVSDPQPDETAIPVVLADNTYEVSNADDHSQIISAITNSDVTEATIMITKDVEISNVSGVAGKHITYRSQEGVAASITLSSALQGDLTLDNVKINGESKTLYCNGHLFETTQRTTTANSYVSVGYTIYGGANRSDITGDTNIILRGGKFKWVYGGGYKGDVNGSTHVTIGAMTQDDKTYVQLQRLYGGGDNSDISGDIHLNFYSGTVSGGDIYGGSEGPNADQPNEVSGDIYIQLGYEGMNNDVISYGTVLGAGKNAKVKNVSLSAYDNSSSILYAGGYNCTVLENIDLFVSGSGDRGHSIYAAGQGTMTIGGDIDVDYRFINTSDSGKNAPSLQIANGDITVNGDVTVTLAATDQRYQFKVLGVNRNSDNQSLQVNGSTTLFINADVDAAYIRGNRSDTDANQTNAENTIRIANGVNVKTGTFQDCGNVIVKEQAEIEVNSVYFPGSFFGPNTEAEGEGADPFQNTYNLTLEKGAVLDTRNVSCTIYGNVEITQAEWRKKGNVTINSNYTADHATLYVPAVLDGKNYGTGTNKVTLRINGEVQGESIVYLMDRSTWSETDSVIGDNYIVAQKLSDSLPAESAFILHKRDMEDDHYLKQMDDVQAPATKYMWQISRNLTYDYQEIYAEDLTVYEGGLGTGTNGQGSVGNALPEPHWLLDFEKLNIHIGDQQWSLADGLPFTWEYRNLETGEVVSDSARAGIYGLYVYPLEGYEDIAVSIGDHQLLWLPKDGWKAAEVKVRDITDNEKADALSQEMFKPVYNYYSPLSARLSRLKTIRYALFALDGDSALNGVYDEETGTHNESCDQSDPHAHVYPGTKFLKNGKADLAVNEYARIGLLWDDLLDDVLGSQARMDMLHAKSAAVCENIFDSDQPIQRKFQYIDLVDMNDGNIWVGTESEAVTIYMPYTADMTKDDIIAVTYFDGLTRDYTVNMDQADLDAEIEKSNAHMITVTKSDTGILFDVPSKQFGPFEVLWQKTKTTDAPDTPIIEQPDDDQSNIDLPNDQRPNDQNDVTQPQEKDEDQIADKEQDDAAADTGEISEVMAWGMSALLSLTAILLLAVTNRKKHR